MLIIKMEITMIEEKMKKLRNENIASMCTIIAVTTHWIVLADFSGKSPHFWWHTVRVSVSR